MVPIFFLFCAPPSAAARPAHPPSSLGPSLSRVRMLLSALGSELPCTLQINLHREEAFLQPSRLQQNNHCNTLLVRLNKHLIFRAVLIVLQSISLEHKSWHYVIISFLVCLVSLYIPSFQYPHFNCYLIPLSQAVLILHILYVIWAISEYEVEP